MIAPGSRPLSVKFILPSLTEATDPYWRPIKYSLFPPLGLATRPRIYLSMIALRLWTNMWSALTLDDTPELVVIQVYITNAYRAYGLQTITAGRELLFASAACMLRRSRGSCGAR